MMVDTSTAKATADRTAGRPSPIRSAKLPLFERQNLLRSILTPGNAYRLICAGCPDFCAFHDESTVDGGRATLHNLKLWLRAGCREIAAVWRCRLIFRAPATSGTPLALALSADCCIDARNLPVLAGG
jgi:hypothetical protein